jgi:hypothetical protein
MGVERQMNGGSGSSDSEVEVDKIKLFGTGSNAGWNEAGASIVTEQFSSCQTAL